MYRFNNLCSYLISCKRTSNQKGKDLLFTKSYIYKLCITEIDASQSKEPDWMRDFEERKGAKEIAIKLKASHSKSYQFLYA